MAKDKFHGTTQFAALPWRISEGGTRQVMLLTSRETRRWVIPKGWPMKKRKPAEVASQEAYEEAGLIGQIVGKRPFGRFHYGKLVGDETVLCEVQVFLLRVERQLDDWPEKRERETKWFEAKEAASLVDEGGLAEIIGRFSEPYIRFAALRGSQRHRPFLSIRHGGRSPSGD
jgi:8-oxo-dGTP pyrophosphatase MutT (NUDIX family)